MLLVSGEQYLQTAGPAGDVVAPAAADPDLARPRRGRRHRPRSPTRDGATHFFLDGEFTTTHRGGTSAPRRPIRDAWGALRATTLDGRPRRRRVRARGTTTYLFSGDQYVALLRARLPLRRRRLPPAAGRQPAARRRRSRSCRRRSRTSSPTGPPPAGRWSTRSWPTGAPSSSSSARRAMSRRRPPRRPTTSRRWAASATPSPSGGGSTRRWSPARRRSCSPATSTCATPARAPASATGPSTTATRARWRRRWPASLGLSEPPGLPEAFRDGIDAAFHGPDGATYLFAGTQFLRIGADPAARSPAPGAGWPTRSPPGGPVDAAFVAPTGELYAFRGGAVRPLPARAGDAIDEGYPRSIHDDWGDLPTEFEDGRRRRVPLRRPHLPRQGRPVRPLLGLLRRRPVGRPHLPAAVPDALVGRAATTG